jgi:hypothetical protein
MDNRIDSVPFRQTSVESGVKREMPDQSCLNVVFRLSVKILFLGGYGSRPGGVNPSILRVHGHTVIEPDLPDDNFAASVAIAQRVFIRHQPDVVVGWSRGGAVAMSIDSKKAPLILVAPAWKNWGTMITTKPEVAILHSPQDDLVSIEDSRELLRNSGLAEDRLVTVGEDHRMIDEGAFVALLEAVECCGNGGEKRRAA